MAKRRRKRTLKKSQAIRDYASTHPGEGPTAVATALQAKGVMVSPAFVSMVTSESSRRSQAQAQGPARRFAIERLIA